MSAMNCAAARLKSTKRCTNSSENTSSPSGQPKWHKSPNYLHALALGSLGHWRKRGKVITSILINAGPTKRIACRTQIQRTQQCVIVDHVPVMLRGGNQVDPLTMAVDMRGGFESSLKKRTEKCGRRQAVGHRGYL